MNYINTNILEELNRKERYGMPVIIVFIGIALSINAIITTALVVYNISTEVKSRADYKRKKRERHERLAVEVAKKLHEQSNSNQD